MRYSHIIVGAGSAGAVLAARLSQRPECQVLLLESGPDHTSDHTPPAVSGNSFFDALAEPGRSWPELLATRTEHQGATVYQRGRGVGGSSSVNAMVTIPGIPEDYDRWEQLGATGWNWASLSPWFARTSLVTSLAGAHETGPVNSALLAALPGRAGPVPLSRTAAGRRMSTNDCYLEPARGRANLAIRGDSHVDRLLFEGRRAVGVRLVDGTEFESDEVFVCAGAIHSPALLLRSGVEPASPDGGASGGIGDGLKDHAAFPVALELADGIDWDPTALPISVLARMSSGESPADLQMLAMNHLGPAVPRVGLIMVALMEVRSRGTVRLASNDALADPVVNFDLLSDPVDERRLRSGIAQLERVLEHPEVRRLGHAAVPPTDPVGLRASLGDYVHASGTCAMGRVVDEHCRVYGYGALRVCDASVFPDLPRANTHLTTVVVAERLASML